MALQEVTNALIRRLRLSEQPLNKVWTQQCRRYASSDANSQETAQLETSSFETISTDSGDSRAGQFDPAGNARKRQRQLPKSRYGASGMDIYHCLEVLTCS